MHVCNIDEESRFGGPEKRIINVATKLYKMGIKTTLIMPNRNNTFFKKYAIKNKIDFQEMSFSALSLQRKLLIRYILRFLIDIFLLRQKIKGLNPDIVHINGAYQFRSAIAAFLARKPVIWHINNTYANPVVFIIFQFISMFTAKAFIAASKPAKKYFLSYPWHRNKECKIIHAPIILSSYYSNKNKQNPNQNLTIGTISGFNRQKNPILFAKTALLVSAIYPKVNFKIAANIPSFDNKYYRKFKDILKGSNCKMKIMGFLEDIPSYLNSLDIFLYTSEWEGSPTALWEAMASGLPIVTRDVGSAKEYINSKLNSGIVTSSNDPIELSEYICQLINNDSLRNEYAYNANNIAFSKLSLEQAALLHSEIYQSMSK